MSVKHVDVKQAYALQTGEGHTYVDVRSVPEYDGSIRVCQRRLADAMT